MTEQNRGSLDAQALLSRGMVLAQREAETIVVGLKERGAGRFGRILGLGLAAVVGAYILLYAPANRKLATIDRRIATAKSTARYADRYKSLRQRLDLVRARLPSAGQGDGWITDRLRQTISDRGLVSDSISQAEARPANGYVDEVVRFSMSAKFPDIVAWLNELELGKPALQVTSLAIEKDSSPIGMNHVTSTVEALLPATPGAKP